MLLVATAVFTSAPGELRAGGLLLVAGGFTAATLPLPVLARWAARTGH